MSIEFQAWPKIPRGQNEQITITEKLDGTNACIVIQDGDIIAVQSRKRFITPYDDNYGFAGWAARNRKELLFLGEGHHFGEWAGLGIQGNPHCLHEKNFFLFNVAKWNKDNPNLPDCCSIVPILFEGDSTPENIDNTLEELWDKAEDKYVPEGIVVWYHKSRRYEKYTFKYQYGKWAS